MTRWDTAQVTSVRLTAINDAFYIMVSSKLVIYYSSHIVYESYSMSRTDTLNWGYTVTVMQAVCLLEHLISLDNNVLLIDCHELEMGVAGLIVVAP